MVALLLQGVDAAGPALGDVDLFFGEQAHQLGARGPVFQGEVPVGADRVPAKIRGSV